MDDNRVDSIIERRSKLIKDKKNKSLLHFVIYLIVLFTYGDIHENVIPIANLILFCLDINNREMILTLISLYIRFLPSFVYIFGQLELKDISREIKEIDNELIEINSQRIKELHDKNNLMNDEESINYIISVIEKLPRNKQMQVLNFIKGDLVLDDEILKSDIKSLNSYELSVLQTGVEDIIFPNVAGKVRKYTKEK